MTREKRWIFVTVVNYCCVRWLEALTWMALAAAAVVFTMK